MLILSQSLFSFNWQAQCTIRQMAEDLIKQRASRNEN